MQRTGTCGRQLQRYGKFEQNIWLLVYVGLCNELIVSSFCRRTPKFTMTCLLASLMTTSSQGMVQPRLLLTPCSLSQALIRLTLTVPQSIVETQHGPLERQDRAHHYRSRNCTREAGEH